MCHWYVHWFVKSILRFQATSEPWLYFAYGCRTRITRLPRDVLIRGCLKGLNCEPLPQPFCKFLMFLRLYDYTLHMLPSSLGKIPVDWLWVVICIYLLSLSSKTAEWNLVEVQTENIENLVEVCRRLTYHICYRMMKSVSCQLDDRFSADALFSDAWTVKLQTQE